MNQKVPSFISESGLQSSLKQLEQTLGDKISWNSKVLEHLEVEKLIGSLDITFLSEKNKACLDSALEAPFYRCFESGDTGNCRFEVQLLSLLLPETGS